MGLVLLAAYCLDGHVTPAMALALPSWYALYVLVVVLGRVCRQKRRRPRAAARQPSLRGASLLEEVEGGADEDEDEDEEATAAAAGWRTGRQWAQRCAVPWR